MFQREVTINVEILKTKFVGGKNPAVQHTVSQSYDDIKLFVVLIQHSRIAIQNNYNQFLYHTEDVVIGESLVLEKVTREDMGKYMCIARNTVQPAASKIFDLSVNCKKLHRCIYLIQKLNNKRCCKKYSMKYKINPCFSQAANNGTTQNHRHSN